MINEEKQKCYQHGVGTLLWLVKNTKSDLSNVTREASKAMNSGIKEDYNYILHVIEYAILTKDRKLNSELNKKDLSLKD